jgi:hypothetical protein
VKELDGLRYTEVRARWTVGGVEHGLRALIRPNADRQEIDDTKESIARAALFNAEMRNR